MTRDQAIRAIFDEISAAEAKHGAFPEDIIHCAAIVAEEAGELVQAAIDFHYCHDEAQTDVQKEAIQTAAMAIRFLLEVCRE